MLLAIDTSAGTAVAVVDPHRGVLAERSETDTRRHAEVIGDLIAAVLRDAGVAAGDVDGVAAGMGPGPFTGLRVGIAAARAFAAGIRRPVLPVVSHDAVAYAEALADGPGPFLVVTDARRRESAWSAYAPADADGLPVRLAGPELAPTADLESTVARRDDLAAAAARRLDAAVIPAGALGMLAAALRTHGRALAPDRPVYLRAPDVTPSAGPKRVTA